MPETWFFYKVIVLLPLMKKWRLGRGNFVLKLSRSHFPRLLLLFSEVSPVSIPRRSLGRTRESLFQSLDAGRHVGNVKVASPGRPDEPPASLLWASGTRGPREAWKTELRHQPSFERWLEERGRTPPAVSPRPSPSATRLHRPRKH